MLKLFLGIFGLLLAASAVTVLTTSPKKSDVPCIYWKTDSNPQRLEQIELFHEWLIKNGHVISANKPIVELKLDSANSQSKLIQAVSGVGGDIIDASVQGFQPLGVLREITAEANSSSFGLDATYPGLKDSLTAYGEQYGYPCNAAVDGLWCNVDAFKKYGMEAPPEVWTPQEFERIGREFVGRANKGRMHREVFFCSSPAFQSFMLPICRSEGLDVFNETLTSCVLNDQRYVDLLQLIYKWTYEYHLFPSASEVLSMNTQSGYGGANFAQFQTGNYAMTVTGRYCLIRMRESNKPINLSLSRVPEYGFQNMIIRARPATLYKGSTNPQLAKLFFEFLADREYNDYIINGSDGLPPNPKYALDNPAYLTPAKYPNEGNTHKRELRWAMTIALPDSASPYYKSTGMDWYKYSISKYFNDLCSAGEAAAETQERVNNAIQTVIDANPILKDQYLLDCELQKKIEQYKAEGRKIPAAWIKNPFYLAYYKARHMLVEDRNEK